MIFVCCKKQFKVQATVMTIQSPWYGDEDYSLLFVSSLDELLTWLKPLSFIQHADFDVYLHLPPVLQFELVSLRHKHTLEMHSIYVQLA